MVSLPLMLLFPLSVHAVTTLQRFLAIPSLPSHAQLIAPGGNFANKHLTVLNIEIAHSTVSTSAVSRSTDSNTYYTSDTQSIGVLYVAFNDTFYTHKLWLASAYATDANAIVTTYASCTGASTSDASWTCSPTVTSSSWISGVSLVVHTTTLIPSTLPTAKHIYAITVADIYGPKNATSWHFSSATSTGTSSSSHPTSTSQAGASSIAQGNDAVRGSGGNGGFAISCVMGIIGLVVMAVL